MTHRHPILVGVVAVAVIVALYAATGRSLSRWLARHGQAMLGDVGGAHRAELVPPPGRRLWGLYRPELPEDLKRFRGVGHELSLKPRVVSFYQAWGDGEEHAFPVAEVERLLGQGLVPLITWEPWLTDFAFNRGRPEAAELAQLLSGETDAYVRQWAARSARVPGALFVRPFHELGNAAYPWSLALGNRPEELVAAWRHVVGIFREEGAENVAFVWTPFRADDVVAWPGEEWVDWVGLDVFNYGTLIPGGKWRSFGELVAPQLDAVRGFGLPVMLAEVGCAGAGGDCTAWWTAAMVDLRASERSPIAAFVAFDHPSFVHGDEIFVDWGFTSRPAVLREMRPLVSAAGFARE